MRLRCVNTAKWIEILLGVETLDVRRNTVLDGSRDFPHGFNAAFAKLLWLLVYYIGGNKDDFTYQMRYNRKL